MFRSVVVSAVGTSLLGNAVRQGVLNRFADLFRGFGVDLARIDRLRPFEEANTPPSGAVCRVLGEGDVRRALIEFADGGYPRSSAELTGVEAVSRLFYLRPGETLVLLYSTETCNALACADIVAQVLKSRGFSVQVEKIPARGSDEEGFYEMLADLLDRVVSRIAEYRSRGASVYVSAVPGFKAEVSFLVLSSLLAGANAAVYIHEAFEAPVILPRPPITLDEEKLRRVLNVFSGSDEVEKSWILGTALSEGELRELIEGALVEDRGQRIALRRWVKALAKALAKG